MDVSFVCLLIIEMISHLFLCAHVIVHAIGSLLDLTRIHFKFQTYFFIFILFCCCYFCGSLNNIQWLFYLCMGEVRKIAWYCCALCKLLLLHSWSLALVLVSGRSHNPRLTECCWKSLIAWLGGSFVLMLSSFLALAVAILAPLSRAVGTAVESGALYTHFSEAFFKTFWRTFKENQIAKQNT